MGEGRDGRGKVMKGKDLHGKEGKERKMYS